MLRLRYFRSALGLIGVAAMIRILLVADVRLHRDGVAALLRGDGRIGVVASARAADDITGGAAGADVVVVDTADEDGLRSVRRCAAASACPMVAIGIPRAEEQVIAFAEAGVVGFVEREAAVEELVASVESVARGEASCPPRVATVLLQRLTSLGSLPPSTRDANALLTARERQIVPLIAEGLSNKEIATRLCIEVATVKNHVHNILEKLQVSRRSDAVARLRLVDTDAAPFAVHGTAHSRAG